MLLVACVFSNTADILSLFGTLQTLKDAWMLRSLKTFGEF